MDIGRLWSPLKMERMTELVDLSFEFFEELQKSNEKDIVTVPDFASFCDFEQAKEIVGAEGKGIDLNIVEVMWALSGKAVRVRRDANNNVALDYRDNLPDDLAPLLILDASGHQRETYRYWYRDRGGLEFLHSPGKNYEGLTIHHWNKGAGKTSWETRQKTSRELADGIARTIDELIPSDEPVLVVTFKPTKRMHPEALIRDRTRGKDVNFLHWGVHDATNEFRACKHVILASVLQYSVPQIEAHGRAAKGLVTEQELTDEECKDTRLGEIAHHVFQAACRGAIRQSVEDQCPGDCHLYVVFSTHKGTGIPLELLGRVFPGARVDDWYPLGFGLKPIEQSIADTYLANPQLKQGQLALRRGISQARVSQILKKANVKAYMAAVSSSGSRRKEAKGGKQTRILELPKLPF